jgi:hypothetical protein
MSDHPEAFHPPTDAGETKLNEYARLGGETPSACAFEYEAIYHREFPDGFPIGMRYKLRQPEGQTVEIPNDYDLPPHLAWVGEYTLNNLASLEEHPQYFHGTRLSRISGIRADGGLKMHPEPDVREKLHSVYATPDPILAAHHAYENGPEDTANPSRDKKDPSDPVVLLKLNIDGYPQDVLEHYHEAAHRTYRILRSGSQSNYSGERMGQFIQQSTLSVVVHDDASGEVVEIPIEQWQP